MKQILHYFKTGELELLQVPCPEVKKGCVLIQTVVSVVSAGTERMLVEFAKANYISKALKQPQKVKQVIDKIRTDGLFPTIDAVRNKLDQPIAMGYSNAGIVLAVGECVNGFSVGDRVVSNGPHAEVVCVPKNLCARIPDDVPYESAAFTVLGSIGLQGIRLAQPTLGEKFVVTGLGLIGNITAQLLQAHGCTVMGIDMDESKLDVARKFGISTVDISKGEDPVAAAATFSHGHGVDGVIITASTRSSEPVRQAAQMCRKRGRIILVGVTGLELSREELYEKELSFQVSCSYGPGRYDPLYEGKGQDYPLGYVRWTEQRNFEAVLDMLASGRLNVEPLISHRFPFEQAINAYDLLTNGETPLGIVLKYSSLAGQAYGDVQPCTVYWGNRQSESVSEGKRDIVKVDAPVVSVIGAGNYTVQIMLPAIKRTGAILKTIASSGGVSGSYAGRKFGFEQTTTETGQIFKDEDANVVFITTRHNTHARFVIEGLRAGKHVFVEKPLCLMRDELEKISSAYKECPGILMVGFNRRFAPHVKKMKEMLDTIREPKSFIVTINAGYIPADHWTQDPKVGGGRIIGEACHFIDLLRYLTGQPIVNVQATRMGNNTRINIVEDKVAITLSFADGSFGTIHYLANGHKSFPKERVEAFCNGRILVLDNFRTLYGYGWPGMKKMKLWRQDKGHAAGVKAFIDSVRQGGPSPILFEEIEEVTRVTLEISEMLR